MSFNFARIPELLSPVPHLSQMSLLDRVPYWFSANNLTTWMELQTLKTFLETGGGVVLPSVSSGGEILYIVPIDDEGDDTYINSSIAGKDFNLTLEGRPMVKQIYDTNGNPTVSGAEYEVLSSGGFHLLNGDTFLPGQRYNLALFQSSGTTPVGTAASLFTGVFQADTNTFLDSTHNNKLIQIRNGSTVTLPDIAATPENTIIVLEASINNAVQPTVKTKNGQYMYMNNGGHLQLHLGFGESIWLFRKGDGWYVINDFGRNYQAVGEKVERWKVGLNELVADGSLVSRTTYKRLFELAQTLGPSYVTDSKWLESSATDSKGQFVENPHRGCFSDGDGSTTFRLPDLRNQFTRGLHIDGAERFYNHPGGRQDDQIREHSHTTGTQPPSGAGFNNGTVHLFNYWNAPEGTNTGQVSTGKVGGTETRSKNVGLLYCIKC